jgi:hypothetical protein
MSNLKWQINNDEECYDLLEIGGIITDDEDGNEDAIVAKVYDMAEFIEFCNSPKYPPPKSKGSTKS